MTYEEYARQTEFTAAYPDALKRNTAELMYLSLGLSAETGEVANHIKKIYRGDKLNQEDLVLELGDVFWYLSRLLSALDVPLEEVLAKNVIKLQRRKAENTLIR